MIGNCKLNGAHIWCMICRDTRGNDCYHANSILCSRSLTLSLSASTIHIGQTYFWSTNLAPALVFFSHQTTNQNRKKWYEFKSLAIYKRNRYSCEINILATSRFGMALKISDIFCLAATPKKGVVTLFAHRIFVHCAVADSPLLASLSLVFRCLLNESHRIAHVFIEKRRKMHATHWVSVVVVCSREKKSFSLNVFLSFAIEVFVWMCSRRVRLYP